MERNTNSRWIPVDEKLPHEGELVIITAPAFGRVVTAFAWYRDGLWRPDAYTVLEAVAWMPMPAPWEGEST